jgi:hypothetical protein
MALEAFSKSIYRIAPRIPSIPFLPAGMPRLATGGAAATPPGEEGDAPSLPLAKRLLFQMSLPCCSFSMMSWMFFLLAGSGAAGRASLACSSASFFWPRAA